MDKLVISNILKELGISANLKGYYYIRYSFELLIKDYNLIDSIMGLYKTVAKKFNTTSSRVERAIRHAIEVGWVRANQDFVNELFGYSVDVKKGQPTNSEFLATVADYVLITQEMTEGETDA
jgi:two-component system response regulator (stage 0 sporulation protein A)